MRMKAFCYIQQAAKSLLISMVIVLAGMVGSAAAVTINLSGTLGGTFDNGNNIDVNADGISAAIESYVWQDATLGNLTFTAVSESVIADPTDECPYGAFTINAAEEMGYGQSTGTAPNGDQLYSYTSTYMFCWTDEVGVSVGQSTFQVRGGTGQFAGATGSMQSTFTSVVNQTYDEVSGQFFGSATLTLTGTLDLPNFNAGDGDGAGDGDSGDDAGSTGPDCNDDGIVNGLDLLGIGCDS